MSEMEAERASKPGAEFSDVATSDTISRLVSSRSAFVEVLFALSIIFPVDGSINLRAFGSGAGSL